MKSIAIVGSKHWANVWSVMRTANALDFDRVYLPDLKVQRGRPPRMNRRKIELRKPPHDMFVLLDMETFLEKIVPQYDVVSMELTERAQELADFVWPDNPLIVLGPEDGNIPDEILKLGAQVKVDMGGVVNCLNVACAGSIAMWDYTLKQCDRI